eukprot:1150870-Pelagomonas_calceolata.AAC.13
MLPAPAGPCDVLVHCKPEFLALTATQLYLRTAVQSSAPKRLDPARTSPGHLHIAFLPLLLCILNTLYSIILVVHDQP